MKNLLFNIAFSIIVSLTGALNCLKAQAVPSPEENIDFLVTFGKDAPGIWGDDDYAQTFFFTIPANYSKPIYLRIFDPELGGLNDELKGEWNSTTRFSVFGGKGAYTDKDAQNINPIGNYDSGTILDTKTFGVSEKYDNKWFVFGPFNPQQGEAYGGFGESKFIFKIIAEGISGDDGNLYHYFLSESPDKNILIEGADPFTFEYSFRVPLGISHIYPFINNKVTAIKINNFDFDMDGYIRLVSTHRKSEVVKTSPDGAWAGSEHKIYDDEKGTTLDIQTVSLVKKENNNIVYYITNQYGETMPFFTNPLGLETSLGIKATSQGK